MITISFYEWHLQCNVDGSQGDGKERGTCDWGNVCNSDGSCSVCSETSSLPHGGCSRLNPVCKGGTECVCDQNSPLSCDAKIHSLCDGFSSVSPFDGGSCLCGTAATGSNTACTDSKIPNCKVGTFETPTDASSVSATCRVTKLFIKISLLPEYHYLK